MKSLYECLKEAWVVINPGGFEESNLPELPPKPNFNIPRATFYKFRANYAKLGEFAAYACGVPIEKLSDFDMMKYIADREKEKNGL